MRTVVSAVTEVVHWVINGIGSIILFALTKKMRIHICILPDANNKGLLSSADATASVARASALIKSKFDVKVSAYSPQMVQMLSEKPPARAYDVEGDGSGYWSTEYGAAGRYFAKYTAGRAGVPITVVHPITVFVVHTVTSNGADWRGASFGLTADYVVLTPTGMNDPTTLAHELGHACDLFHRKKKANLMHHAYTRGTSVTGWQKWWFRLSRHVNFW